MIKLGSKVRDTYTGFTGIAISRVEFLYGCARICIESQELKDGKPIDQYFDEQRVELVIDKPPTVSKDSIATSGGPHPNPTRQADPR